MRPPAWLVIGLLGVAACGGDRFDVLLEHGWVVDGAGNARYRADIGIVEGRIAAIGSLTDAAAARRIDATDLVVAPGFIDMLGWSEIKLLADGRALSKITQGITTEVTGEGTSVSPLNAATSTESEEYYGSFGVTVDWRDLDGYFRRLESAGSALNVASFVGATQIRKVVLGSDDRAPGPRV